MSQIGRPAKAKPAKSNELQPGMLDAFLGKEADPSLVWSVSRAEIMRAVQTVGGIAKLAKVDRKTVCRRGVETNSLKAVEFVRDRRLAIGRPLVSPRNQPLFTDRFVHVVKMVRRLQEMKYAKLVEGRSDSIRPMVDHELDTKKEKWRGRRGGKFHQIEAGTPAMTDALRVTMKRYGFFYEGKGFRVTVKQVCSILRWSRSWFYKWREGLNANCRQRLNEELSGRLYQKRAPRERDEESPRARDFFSDREPERFAFDDGLTID